MIDVLLVLVCALLAASTVAAVEYYRELRKAQKEYEKAKDTVEDIVFSFSRELRREAETIESIAFKMDGTTIKADAGLRRIEGLEKRVAPLESQLSVQLNTFNVVSESNAQTIEKLTTMDTKLETVDNKIRDIESSQESIKTKITGLEEQIQKLATVPEMKTELIMPGIPIKREKAMAALTDTEIAVLEFLSAEGPKTAPEIKEKVKLSREHTSRLMKKLYEEGYLERETGKLPFKYSIKKEMEKFLMKPEPHVT